MWYVQIFIASLAVWVIKSSTAQNSMPNCSNQPDGKLFPSESSQSEFYICVGSIPLHQKCPYDLSFCYSSGFCSETCGGITATTSTSQPPIITPPPVSSTTKPTTVKCDAETEGTIYPVPGSCSGYILCKDGKAVTGECMNGLAFDAVLGVCSNKPCP